MIFRNFKHLIFIGLLTITTAGFGQGFTLQNEEVIFSFDTRDGKKVTLNKDKANHYIIYRFGTKDTIEFEFPDTSNNSWANFEYSFWLRGGGRQNEGLDLNYIYFTDKNFKYIIYDTYFAAGKKRNIGIKILDLETNKTINLRGDIKTRKGTLIDFRDNKLLEIGEELFE